MKKAISTTLTPANIASVTALLTATPHTLSALSAGRAPEALRQPLGVGERSFIEVVAHLVNSDERTTETIYAALLLDEPLVLAIHPERDWGKLLRYEQCECAELLAYYSFRRATLLRVLNGLSAAQWERSIREAGKQRAESVYWRARAMALHEAEHVAELESRLTQTLS
ncbi:MAG: DinB family protein [Anaerolineae bacterium]|nr:DinB family protein [Anaerolineae bacterium]